MTFQKFRRRPSEALPERVMAVPLKTAIAGQRGDMLVMSADGEQVVVLPRAVFEQSYAARERWRGGVGKTARLSKTESQTPKPSLKRGPKLCQVPECTGAAHCKGYCMKHYLRVRRYGSPELPAGHKPRRVSTQPTQQPRLRGNARFVSGAPSKERPPLYQRTALPRLDPKLPKHATLSELRRWRDLSPAALKLLEAAIDANDWATCGQLSEVAFPGRKDIDQRNVTAAGILNRLLSAGLLSAVHRMAPARDDKKRILKHYKASSKAYHLYETYIRERQQSEEPRRLVPRIETQEPMQEPTQEPQAEAQEKAAG